MSSNTIGLLQLRVMAMRVMMDSGAIIVMVMMMVVTTAAAATLAASRG